ncbi:MAG: hypothetical protein ACOZBW_13240 [Thermodesulfobacteriota bacterium]
MATERELMASRIFLRAVLPVIRVLLEDDPRIRKRFEKVKASVQFVARDPAGDVGACLMFDNGAFTVMQGVLENPDITFVFGSVASMNAMFAGKPALPWIKGLFKVGLLIKVMTLLLALKVLMPNCRPTDPLKKRLKVKMTFYMITTAMSQYNKGGDPEMVKWTAKQPERIYQVTVDDQIAAHLRVKAGQTKAGRGPYTKRRPFIHLRFNGVDGALPVILNDVDMVTAVREGHLSIDGSPEYGRDFGDFMMRIQALIT